MNITSKAKAYTVIGDQWHNQNFRYIRINLENCNHDLVLHRAKKLYRELGGAIAEIETKGEEVKAK